MCNCNCLKPKIWLDIIIQKYFLAPKVLRQSIEKPIISKTVYILRQMWGLYSFWQMTTWFRNWHLPLSNVLYIILNGYIVPVEERKKENNHSNCASWREKKEKKKKTTTAIAFNVLQFIVAVLRPFTVLMTIRVVNPTVFSNC